jgi:FSR family fosmidomycin resistance protein-like MFS transporter
MALLIYNLLAFGGQYPVAIWLEKIRNRKAVLMAAFLLNLAAAVMFPFLSAVAVVLAGLASAVYHVAGGAVCAADRKSFSIGLFAAPGVAGLIAGGYFAWSGLQLSIPLMLLCMVFLLLLMALPIPMAKTVQPQSKITASPDSHDFIMILLLTVIALRSAVWNIFQLVHEKEYDWLLGIALAAFAGKIAGGWLADRIGWRTYTYISLLGATPLISFFRDELILFSIGIGLLQSGIPATTALLINAAGGRTERGIGLAFGTAIILGAFSFAIPATVFNSVLMIPAGCTVFILLLFYFSGHQAKRTL